MISVIKIAPKSGFSRKSEYYCLQNGIFLSFCTFKRVKELLTMIKAETSTYQVLLRLIDFFFPPFLLLFSPILLFFNCFLSVFANWPVLSVSFIETSFISSCLFSSLFFSLILRWGVIFYPNF